MANPQKEKGYTAIANEILENLIKYEFPKNTGDTPFKICLFVLRKTYGFHKKEDNISLTQFEKAIKKSRPVISYWLKYLSIAKLLIVDTSINKNGFSYKFNKNYDEWLQVYNSLLLVVARNYTSNMATNATSNMATTHKRKKEIYKRKEFYLLDNNLENIMYNYCDIDEDGNPIIKKKGLKRISKDENTELIKIGLLWRKMCAKYLEVNENEVVMKNIYYPIRALYAREKYIKDDFEKLFKYFLEDKNIKQEDKMSFDLMMSEKYVAKYKISKRSKETPRTLSQLSNEIQL